MASLFLQNRIWLDEEWKELMIEEIREEKAEEIAEPVKAEVKEEAPVVEKQEERPAEEPKKARELAEVQPQTVEAERLPCRYNEGK